MEVQENDQETIEHNENKQGQSEEQGAQEVLVDQIDSLVNTVGIFSEDIKMEFRLPKCGVLVMKRGKVVQSERISMPNGKMMKNIEEGRYKYLGILEADDLKHKEIKGQIKKGN